jgi:hypothetical protein
VDLTAIEYVTRHKLRFTTTKGALALEDLWDLPLTSETGKTNLNDIAKGIHSTLKTDETNFVETEGVVTDVSSTMMLEAVKRIIAVKQDERKSATAARDKSARKQELLDALATAEGTALRSKSPEEIRAMLAAL